MFPSHDHGAGLGLGTDVLIDEFERDVESFEPNTRKWEGKRPPTYTKSQNINKKYDNILSINVINVVPKRMRDFIIKDIFNKLNEGGTAFISSRAWKGDILNTKNFEVGEEEKSYLVLKTREGKKVKVFQKGYDGKELLNYVKSLLGDAAQVE